MAKHISLIETHPNSRSLLLSRAKYRAQRSLWIVPAALGLLMVFTNHWVNEVDDEYTILDQAAKPVARTMSLFLKGVGQHEHPPLYDVLIHAWLRLTGGNEHLLRVPSIFFYALGVYVIALVARRFGGIQSQVCVLVLIAIWPFGFYFGRLATWYSFCFLLVSLVTLLYLRFVDRPSVATWALYLVGSLALIYSNYFGWALLACLAADFVIRNRGHLNRSLRVLLYTGLILLIAYIPLMRAFWRELHSGPHFHGIGLTTVANGIYGMYCLFVSESVAPWFWFLGIPTAIAVTTCLLLILLWSPTSARRFLLYFLALFTVMTLLGIAIPKRLLFISPWLLLAIGIALGANSNRLVRGTLMAALAVTSSVGWYGIFARRYYAAPHWLEPWELVARRAALVVHDQGIVIGDNPSFFFYLSYMLPSKSSLTFQDHGFVGYLPNSIQTQRVYDDPQWNDAGRPISTIVFLVRGLHYGMPSLDDADRWLNDHCAMTKRELMVHDPGAQWKRRFAPAIEEPEWRIELKTYFCQRNRDF